MPVFGPCGCRCGGSAPTECTTYYPPEHPFAGTCVFKQKNYTLTATNTSGSVILSGTLVYLPTLVTVTTGDGDLTYRWKASVTYEDFGTTTYLEAYMGCNSGESNGGFAFGADTVPPPFFAYCELVPCNRVCSPYHAKYTQYNCSTSGGVSIGCFSGSYRFFYVDD